MRADRFKQVLKNRVYRTIGETASAIGGDGNGERTLRVLMYHKVNDLPGNPLTMPVSIFDEQMEQLRDLGYTVVDLDAVLDHYVEGKPLPERAVLITFDDGYRDNLANAARVLGKYGYPAVLFVPIGYLDDRHPLPHEEHLAARGSSTGRSTGRSSPSSSDEGIRIESHGIATGRSPTSRSTRPRARSRSRSSGSKSALGRPGARVRVRQGLRGALQAGALSLVRQAGYDIAFTSVSGANAPATDPLQLHRYNIEPYPPRTFELVLAARAT